MRSGSWGRKAPQINELECENTGGQRSTGLDTGLFVATPTASSSRDFIDMHFLASFDDVIRQKRRYRAEECYELNAVATRYRKPYRQKGPFYTEPIQSISLIFKLISSP